MIKLPSKDDYKRFIDDFSSALKQHNPDICFYTYGSYASDQCDYGRSDIDGGLIFDCGIVTPKSAILGIAEILADARLKYGIDVDFNVSDKESSLDGRFLAYSDDYTDWIKSQGIIWSGPDLLYCLNGKNFRSQVLHSASFNFCGPHGVRQILLYSAYQFYQNNDAFVKDVIRGLEKVAKFPKKLVWLRDGVVIPSRFAAKERLESLLDADLSFVDRINQVLSQPKELIGRLYVREQALELLCYALDCLENIIGLYIQKFPEISERELRK